MKELAFLQQGRIAQQQILEDGSLFPMVLLPPDENPSIGSLLNAIQHNKEWIDSQLKQTGALLFRGFPLRSASDFNAVVEAFGWKEHPYLGLGSRTRIEGRVYTANEAPLDQPIKFHHEMAMFDEFPTKLIFFCEIAPPEGGQTAIVLSHKITQRMEQRYPQLVKKLEEVGLIIPGNIPQEDNSQSFLKGWQSRYETNNKQEAEEKLAMSGVPVSWEVGDVLVLDNRFVQHARRPSTPPRRVLVAFCK